MMDHPAIVVIVAVGLAIGFFWTVMAVFNHYVESMEDDE